MIIFSIFGMKMTYLQFIRYHLRLPDNSTGYENMIDR
jgi:hypothetical protein